MSIYTDENKTIEINLTAEPRHEAHDTINSIWGGVDFIIEETDRQIWLEMKNWNAKDIEEERRDEVRASFLSKMASNEYQNYLRGKFWGTCSFLTLTGMPPNAPILYVLLLEPTPKDSILRENMMKNMRSKLPPNGVTARPWRHSISVVVVDVDEWNSRFPQYPARLL
jgi:hypothetical protein